MEKKTDHIIKEGIHKEVTSNELQQLNESHSNFTFDMNWYLSNGYVTLESIREKCEGGSVIAEDFLNKQRGKYCKKD